MVSGKDSSNPLMVDNLPKVIWYSAYHVDQMKSWLVQKQTALGKDESNPFLVDGILKTIWLIVTAVSLKFMLFGLTNCGARLMLLGHQVNDVVRLQALIDRKKVIITEATVREALRLDDAKSIDCLPNELIFTELSRMGTSWNEFSSSMALAVICLSTVAAGVDVDDVSAADAKPTLPSPTPTIQPPPPSKEIPSTFYVIPTPPPSPIAEPSSPPQQHQPLQPIHDAKISLDLLHTLLETCTTLTKKVEALDQDKVAQVLEIIKLKHKVKKLKRKNKLKVSGLRRLRKVGTTQRVESSTDTIMDDQEDASKKGEIIANIDADEDVTLKDVAAVENNAEIEKDANVQGRPKKQKPKPERTLKRTRKSLEEKTSKKQKLDEEVKELKKHLQIVPNDDDDVYTEALPLDLKVPVVDYEIYSENNKPFYKIIRADGSHQLFLSFLSLLRSFDREDLEVRWQLVKKKICIFKAQELLR
nr:hypothetical protein [Tanacetum cinerariifolium]